VFSCTAPGEFDRLYRAQAAALGYVPLPETLVGQIKGYWAEKLRVSM
jgi:hypothetical protein